MHSNKVQMVTINLKNRALMKTLKHLMAVYPKKKIEAFKNPCELTVIDGKAIFIIFGANFPVQIFEYRHFVKLQTLFCCGNKVLIHKQKTTQHAEWFL